MNITGQRIAELAKKKNLTQKDLANSSGVTESAMSYYFRGDRTPRGSVLIRIAKALETSTDYLLGYTDDGSVVNNEKIVCIQRGLTKLTEDDLDKAENMLKIMFEEVFGDEKNENKS